MAKAKSKETSMAVIVWAVFMTVLAIGLGVFVYVLYSDQEAKDALVAKAEKEKSDLRAQAKEATGKVSGDKSTENEGKLDQTKANLKDAGEKVKDAFK